MLYSALLGVKEILKLDLASLVRPSYHFCSLWSWTALQCTVCSLSTDSFIVGIAIINKFGKSFRRIGPIENVETILFRLCSYWHVCVWHRRRRRRTVLGEYVFLSVENIFVTLGDSVSSTSLNLLVSRIGLGIIIYIGPVGFYFIAPLGNGNFTIHVN